jgi:hypothetical protein
VDVQVELAVLAVLGDGNSRTSGGDERVKDERERLTVVGERAADGALGAARATIGHGGQVDLRRVNTFGSGGGEGEAGESEDSGELHGVVRVVGKE